MSEPLTPSEEAKLRGRVERGSRFSGVISVEAVRGLFASLDAARAAAPSAFYDPMNPDGPDKDGITASPEPTPGLREAPFVVRQFEGQAWVPLREAVRLHEAHQDAVLTIAGLRNAAALAASPAPEPDEQRCDFNCDQCATERVANAVEHRTTISLPWVGAPVTTDGASGHE